MALWVKLGLNSPPLTFANPLKFPDPKPLVPNGAAVLAWPNGEAVEVATCPNGDAFGVVEVCPNGEALLCVPNGALVLLTCEPNADVAEVVAAAPNGDVVVVEF